MISHSRLVTTCLHTRILSREGAAFGEAVPYSHGVNNPRRYPMRAGNGRRIHRISRQCSNPAQPDGGSCAENTATLKTEGLEHLFFPPSFIFKRL